MGQLVNTDNVRKIAEQKDTRLRSAMRSFGGFVGMDHPTVRQVRKTIRTAVPITVGNLASRGRLDPEQREELREAGIFLAGFKADDFSMIEGYEDAKLYASRVSTAGISTLVEKSNKAKTLLKTDQVVDLIDVRQPWWTDADQAEELQQRMMDLANWSDALNDKPEQPYDGDESTFKGRLETAIFTTFGSRMLELANGGRLDLQHVLLFQKKAREAYTYVATMAAYAIAAAVDTAYLGHTKKKAAAATKKAQDRFVNGEPGLIASVKEAAQSQATATNAATAAANKVGDTVEKLDTRLESLEQRFDKSSTAFEQAANNMAKLAGMLTDPKKAAAHWKAVQEAAEDEDGNVKPGG